MAAAGIGFMEADRTVLRRNEGQPHVYYTVIRMALKEHHEISSDILISSHNTVMIMAG